MNSEKTERVPLAKIFHVKEMDGRVAKRLEVPVGRQGVFIDEAGTEHLLPPGVHQVVSVSARLQGKGAKIRAGYVPAANQRYPAWLAFSNLLSGDRQLVDASLLLEVSVADAGRFFQEVTMPRGVIEGPVLDLDDIDMDGCFEGFAREYAAADLVGGVSNQRLISEARLRLESNLVGRGLQIAGITLLTFWRSEDRLAAQQKARSLEARLAELEVQQQMEKIDNELEAEEYLAQIDPPLMAEAGLDSAELAQERKVFRLRLGPLSAQMAHGESLRLWAAELKRDGQLRPWRIERLVRSKDKKRKESEEIHKKKYGRWWLPRALWITGVLLAALLLTGVLNTLAEAASWDNRLEILLGIWGFVIVVVLESVKALYEKWEKINEEDWSEPGITFLDDLSRKNRGRVDMLVREQAGGEMLHSRDILNNLRSRIYKKGDTQMALQVKSLEKELENVWNETQNSTMAVPPYLGDLKISNSVWQGMLDYDEQLLVRAAALSEDVHNVEQMFSRGELREDVLDSLLEQINAFRFNFTNRSRALRANAENRSEYSMEV